MPNWESPGAPRAFSVETGRRVRCEQRREQCDGTHERRPGVACPVVMEAWPLKCDAVIRRAPSMGRPLRRRTAIARSAVAGLVIGAAGTLLTAACGARPALMLGSATRIRVWWPTGEARILSALLKEFNRDVPEVDARLLTVDQSRRQPPGDVLAVDDADAIMLGRDLKPELERAGVDLAAWYPGLLEPFHGSTGAVHALPYDYAPLVVWVKAADRMALADLPFKSAVQVLLSTGRHGVGGMVPWNPIIWSSFVFGAGGHPWTSAGLPNWTQPEFATGMDWLSSVTRATGWAADVAWEEWIGGATRGKRVQWQLARRSELMNPSQGWSASLLPSGPRGRRVPVRVYGLAINRASSHPTASMTLLKWLFSRRRAGALVSALGYHPVVFTVPNVQPAWLRRGWAPGHSPGIAPAGASLRALPPTVIAQPWATYVAHAMYQILREPSRRVRRSLLKQADVALSQHALGIRYHFG